MRLGVPYNMVGGAPDLASGLFEAGMPNSRGAKFRFVRRLRLARHLAYDSFAVEAKYCRFLPSHGQRRRTRPLHSLLCSRILETDNYI